MVEKSTADKFTLTIPLSASGIEDVKPGEEVKVVAKDRKGKFHAQTVKIGKDKKGVATFHFLSHPGPLHVVVGPADASEEDLMGLQTLSLEVSTRQWTDRSVLELPDVVIPPYYWFWWRRWCRTFTIRGVVRCPDGNPAPGAKVCAFDVDWWWWWSSRQLIDCVTTDASGAFEITFKWCCGWWPWWWWRGRFWRLEPDLVDRIQPILQLDPTLPKIADPTPQPSTALFERLLSEDGEPARLPQATVDPSELPGLRKGLLKRLPREPELEHLKIWPWWPWSPWWDCHPDIIFQVTQDCQGEEHVIVDESVWDTRWNIPMTLDVTLVANENACCVGQHDIPEGECLLIATACDDLVVHVGGNPPGVPGVAADTDGFRNPGGGTTWSDRPYAGVIPIHGEFGDSADVDYYEFKWSNDDGATWNPMPTEAAGNFKRWYHGPKVGTMDPPDWHRQDFNFSLMEDTGGNKHYVVESRQHFEANNDPGTWGLGNIRQWAWTTVSLLMRWKTEGIFADGRYRLHVKSWKLSGAKLDTWGILPLCNTSDPNGIVLYLDNRVVTGGPTNANGQACGGETVHLCTTEPDTDIVSVKILHSNGTETPVAACGNVPITGTDKLQIDLVAYDPDGHLGIFTLYAHWGEDGRRNLLSLGTLTPLSPSPVAWAPPASQVGPTYGQAQTQTATPPIWHGGALRLTIDNATDAFPVTCCYLLQLIARKRTIFNCDDDTWTHINRSERSFMIQV